MDEEGLEHNFPFAGFNVDFVSVDWEYLEEEDELCEDVWEDMEREPPDSDDDGDYKDPKYYHPWGQHK